MMTQSNWSPKKENYLLFNDFALPVTHLQVELNNCVQRSLFPDLGNFRRSLPTYGYFSCLNVS